VEDRSGEPGSHRLHTIELDFGRAAPRADENSLLHLAVETSRTFDRIVCRAGKDDLSSAFPGDPIGWSCS
jgi:hypothetical protein